MSFLCVFSEIPQITCKKFWKYDFLFLLQGSYIHVLDSLCLKKWCSIMISEVYFVAKYKKFPVGIAYFRPSRVVCMVTTVHITCRQQHYMCTKICACYWFLYVKIIWICQCVFLIFLPLAWLPPPLIHHVVMLATSIWCTDFFVCFYRNRFCNPAKNYISLSQS